MTGREVTEVLSEDHREIERLYAAFEAATEADPRQEVMRRLTTYIVSHDVATEVYLFRRVRKEVPGGDELADRILASQAVVERALKDVEKMLPVGPAYLDAVEALMTTHREHVSIEEDELHPLLTEHIEPADRFTMGDRIETAKRVGPVRPHPGAPDIAALNRVVGVGVGMVDRVRNFVESRTG